ncbi:DUF934 domain-containing protein [Caballeronia sp. LZ065]|uniref:DUF934 domain-containing protein n=1 Tax=Caballeronia sp. LZ065 TaxID=3038571 RepID=UPI00285911D3|nr:DUF934 domain-containing protein [Caballeronia sp. LZ065]MDR5778674.1 DUF934 domain-containing protein [Caballeronia sp. LZ065]
MTLIIKNRAIVEDAFTVVRAAEDGTLPAVDALPAGKIIVPFALWKEHKAAIVATRPQEDIGVWLAPDDEPADLVADFAQLNVIAVDFPVFRDGRGFSIGRLLRERYQWTGELRAIGDVLRDQVAFHARCGFDAFAVRADKDIHDALNAFGEFTELYQGATDNPEPLFRRRAALIATLGA